MLNCLPRNSIRTAAGQAVAEVRARAGLLALFVGSIWLVFLADALLPFLHLGQLGVVPRTGRGFLGILFAPWLHANLGHILANTGGLLVLGWLTLWPRPQGFFEATLGAMLGAGLLAWVAGGPGSVHIGASGVVFGYASYLVARGYYARSFGAMAVALFVAASYGVSMLLGLLPIYPGVSWQSHVGGALGGLLTARLCFRKA